MNNTLHIIRICILCISIAIFADTAFAQVIPRNDCSRSQCGCWQSTLLAYSNVVVDKATREPVPGISVLFKNTDTPITYSDSLGLVQFELTAEFSPGCKFGSKNHLVFVDSTEVFVTTEQTVFQTDTVWVSRLVKNIRD